MHILNVAYVTLVVLLLFGSCIFVHEFGHFWMALRRGLKVEAFAIGFGPRRPATNQWWKEKVSQILHMHFMSLGRGCGK